ncbi:MAG TPA: T9SS type A sorting domain-containing protein [Ignavibacteria bacterium]|nr:T9SS type A sorting domain-containing protein [Ignavibacteria bacterium]
MSDNDVLNFGNGYIKSDITEDKLTDATDYALVDNNVLNFESAKNPLLGDNYLRGEYRTSNLTEHFYENTGSEADENLIDLPKIFNLENNYPKPFNPSTAIKFSLSSEANVKLAVYDITGREVSILVNENLNAGVFEYQWNGSGLSSGVYYYKLKTEIFSQVKKIIFVKLIFCSDPVYKLYDRNLFYFYLTLTEFKIIPKFILMKNLKSIILSRCNFLQCMTRFIFKMIFFIPFLFLFKRDQF